ncbi:MAG: OadG family protein [Deltaproteobacteria bacterium]|nr:OadG family protein [Deltaproteobacteria bacterium]
MNGDIYTGLMLLSIGITTVFGILTLIVLFGNLLIHLVNKYIPEMQISTTSAIGIEEPINKDKIAAIVAAVEAITGGKGRAVSIRKKK